MLSQFKFYSKGIVAEDYIPLDNSKGYIKVFAEEVHTSSTVTLGDDDTVPVNAITATDDTNVGKLTKTTNLKARWLNLNDSNRVTPPFVHTGEDIMIFTFGEADVYYWTTLFTELDLRKKETVLYMYGNQDEFGTASQLDNSYWKLIDTIGKIVQFHTSNNDGEACGYDFILDTKKGTYKLEDTIGNRFFLDSPKRTLTIDLKILNLNIETININGKDIHILGDLLDIKSTVVDVTAKAFTISGGAIKLNSTVAFGASSAFNAPVKMNNNAKTTVGPHGHVHTIV